MLVAAGSALVAAHLLDLALAGPRTSAVAVACIVAMPVVAVVLRARTGRLTRFALAVAVGLTAAGTGVASSVLDLFGAGPRWADLTGVGYSVGGVLLVVAGVAALAGPPPARPIRRWPRRAAGAAGWAVGAIAVGQLLLLPFVTAAISTHAARVPVDHGALGLPHEEVRIDAPGGTLAGWWVPSRNGGAVLVVHGSGGDRSKVAAQIRLVAARGFGVLAIDLPGHGESDGRASLLGFGAQPALHAAVGWLAARPGVDPRRLVGYGVSLGAEVLLEAAARDARLRAVVADGAERVADDRRLRVEGAPARLVSGIALTLVRGISGTSPPPALLDVVRRIAPRRVLLIAAGGRPHEIAVNRAYRAAIGPSADMMALPGVGHTRGIADAPGTYARRVGAFLDAVAPGGAR